MHPRLTRALLDCSYTGAGSGCFADAARAISFVGVEVAFDDEIDKDGERVVDA